MHGNKKESDGLVRLDFPGGFPGDKVNDFIAADRTPLQNEAFDFIQKILKWRKGNEVISKGNMTHFMPTNGIYLYQRKFKDKRIIVIMNGNDTAKSIDMSRYKEILKPGEGGIDIISGEPFICSPRMDFAPRALYIIDMTP